MTDAERSSGGVYRDPVDEIWLAAARALGVRVVRSAEVFASYDGRGTLVLSTPEHMDPDDSLAQLILHELCHALVAGQGAFAREDWGLSNLDARDLTAEHACHRLQAALVDAYGLRRLFGVTTEHRPYWDALGAQPLADCPEDSAAVALAREAFERAERPPFGPVLHEALGRTAQVAAAVRGLAPDDSLWAGQAEPAASRSTSQSSAPSPQPPPARAIHVREAQSADYAQVRALFGVLDGWHREALPWLFRSSDEELRPDALLAQLSGDAGALFVAEHGPGTELVGFVVVLLQDAPAPRIFVPGKRAIIDALVVAPEARRKGVGRALLQRVEAWAREKAALRLELNVYELNEGARRFYESAGYTVMSRRLTRRS